MTAITLNLSATYTPAFYVLAECAQQIALAHGEDVAIDWAHRVLDADIELFCVISADRRPALRLIQGGI